MGTWTPPTEPQTFGDRWAAERARRAQLRGADTDETGRRIWTAEAIMAQRYRRLIGLQVK